ncbi:hypothetical protein PF010_g20546 [Phytophthora fragariae]|uniref:Secreted protein n=1 Tax=Phytophthora fragariae TaxID=53985 RepID=A0A6A3RJY8_9STRA|nr:hypothetical protein PF003_g6902 [Phytophthora fragariae]KAE8927575.1 hypothetical protein PF009_g22260 [Phytophthora fragariae]KAE9085214.1 hypothetical protein PF010_g20546 [Phytophthora fragariae]KAE9097245.1 hypothetical protein PF007_g16690 [Phytophthora fragariae]KAE9289227.1 hypothetical protein PF001_g20144 [Phytophthora fragariae]
MLSAAGTGCVLFSLLWQLCPYECRLLTRRHFVCRFFYTTTKNPRNVTRKLSLRKVPERTLRFGCGEETLLTLSLMFCCSTTRLSGST